MGDRRRFFVPEVVQTSGMDCGPAALKCLLEGFGVHASYGRLREACQTDVDGTSIDTLEDVACQLGLDAEQIMIPPDHVLLGESAVLPAIAVVRLPNGVTHFLVLWRMHGPLVQLMDPASGRRWVTRRRFLEELYVHQMPVPAAQWRTWAADAQTLAASLGRLTLNGIARSAAERALARAGADPGWRGFAAVDAAGRMTGALVRSGGVGRGSEATRLFERSLERCVALDSHVQPFVPRGYWTVWPSDDSERIVMRGAVLVSVRGRRQKEREQRAGEASTARQAQLPPELVAALDEPPVRPWRTFIGLVRQDGLLTPGLLITGLAAATLGVIIEALLFRGVFDIGGHLTLGGQRVGAALALAALVAALLLVEFPIAAAVLRIGRRLEARLRLAFLEKVPRLGDRYFRSRPTSDMAERSHSSYQIRQLPEVAAQFVRSLFELVLTAAAIAWIDPASAPYAIVSAALALTLPLLFQPHLHERDLRVRTHAGALGRFYLDAFLGLVAVRAHGAESSMRREHESLLVEWVRAARALQRSVVTIEGLQLTAGFGLAAWLLFERLGRGGEPGAVLLLAYWALNLPVLGQELAQAAWQYPLHRNLTLRLIEPLGALEETPSIAESKRSTPRPDRGAAIEFENVSVNAGGHRILDAVRLSIESGAQVAVVGASGAGKSSLVGLLLGWHRPASGRVLVDGVPLDGEALERLRRETAWVDPSVHLWNRSLLENLRYGATSDETPTAIGAAVDAADLREVLQRLPDGLQTSLGEGGGLVSGGEGQRVRLGRALQRDTPRLVVLDEPFRGLERERRRALLDRSRRCWRTATLLCITHDVSETLSFDRVIVVDQGRIVEDGRPAALAARPDSRYRAMLDAEGMIREGLWNGDGWRALRLERGAVSERRSEQST